MAESIANITGTLAGRYTIVGEVGRGGMATVYRAHDLRHGGEVAIKVLRSELTTGLMAERFAREIRITARLQHPNILPVLDSGTVDEIPYYVMPFVDGESLQARVRREGQLPIDEAVRLTGEIADALSYAHRQGVVHRDVKPSNVLVSHGHAIVADFGIARALDAAAGDRITSSGLAIGTAHYMSPEQAWGTVDGRSDTYSLGCLLYEMLAGSPPFDGASAQTIMARHATDPVPSLRTVRGTVTPALEEAIGKALSKTPADRYADPNDFKVAIQHAATNPRRLTRRDSVRRRSLAGIAVAVLLVAVLWRVNRGGAGSLDRNRVMVFPLAVAADARIPRDLGENISTMIGSVLDGTGPLRWIDAWPLLGPTTAEGPILDARAEALARSKGCAYFVSGRIFTAGDSVRAVLYLYDVAGDSTVATVSASGGADAARLALLSVNRILPKLFPGVPPTATVDWEDRNPKAIASFLLAESDFRRARFARAVANYRAAIEADSAFGLAAIRGAQAASWNHSPSQAAALVAVATRQPLPTRYAEFALGYQAYLEGRADSAAGAFRRALVADAGMAAAWHQMGEVYIHLLPLAGDSDSLAAAAFEAARELDPTATGPLFHLIQIRLRSGDISSVTLLAEQFLAAAPDTTLARQIEIATSCLARGPTHVDWQTLARLRPLPLYNASSALAAGAAQVRCAEPGFVALLKADTGAAPEADGRRWNALIGLTAIQLATGRSHEASAAIDAFVERWKYGSSLFLLAAPFDSLFQRRAQTLAAADARQWGTKYERLPYATRLSQLGLLAAATGNSELARSIASDLRRRADSTHMARDLLLARSLFVRVALAAKDSSAAFDTLRALVPAAAPTADVLYDEAWPLAGERLLLAQMWLAQQKPQLALDVATVIDSPGAVFHGFYIPASLTIRNEAASALGDGPLRSRLRRRMDALRSDGRSE